MNENLISHYVELFFFRCREETPTYREVLRKTHTERTVLVGSLLSDDEWIEAQSRVRSDKRWRT